MATEKQVNYIQALMKGKNSAELKSVGMTQKERAGIFDFTDVERASGIIERLKNR